MVKFEVGEMSRSFRYDVNAICDIEEKLGKGIDKIFSEESVNFTIARALLWGGIKHCERNLTIEKAGLYMKEYLQSGKSINDIIELCLRALQEDEVFGKGASEEEEIEADNKKK